MYIGCRYSTNLLLSFVLTSSLNMESSWMCPAACRITQLPVEWAQCSSKFWLSSLFYIVSLEHVGSLFTWLYSLHPRTSLEKNQRASLSIVAFLRQNIDLNALGSSFSSAQGLATFLTLNVKLGTWYIWYISHVLDSLNWATVAM